jgi:hypothetical protein
MMNLVASRKVTTEPGGLGLHQRIVTIEGAEKGKDHPDLKNTHDLLLLTGGMTIIHVGMIRRERTTSLKTEGLGSIHHPVKMKKNKVLNS